MAVAGGTFEVVVWDETPYDERAGAKLSRVHIEKTFRGDMEGASTTDIVTAVAEGEKSMAYSGFERFDGTLGGRRGTFVLGHVATALGGERSLDWTVLPDSGTGELAGIQGRGTIEVDDEGVHTYTLEYEVG